MDEQTRQNRRSKTQHAGTYAVMTTGCTQVPGSRPNNPCLRQKLSVIATNLADEQPLQIRQRRVANELRARSEFPPVGPSTPPHEETTSTAHNHLLDYIFGPDDARCITHVSLRHATLVPIASRPVRFDMRLPRSTALDGFDGTGRAI